MVAAERQEVRCPLGSGLRRRLDLPDGLLDAEWGAGDVAGVGYLLSKRLGFGPGIEGPEHLRSRPDGGGAEAGAGPVDDTAVERNAENRDLGFSDGIQGREAGTGGRAGEARRLHRGDRPDHAVLAPTHGAESKPPRLDERPDRQPALTSTFSLRPMVPHRK